MEETIMSATLSATLAPERILKEMSDIWVQLAKQVEGDTAVGALRSCSMTLVVIAQEGEDAMALGETIAALMPEHPARTIVIWPKKDEPLGAKVTAQCWMPFGQKRQICCEQIEITAPEGSMPDVASVISPIAAPDLPLIVWCRCRGTFEEPGFGALAEMANKVIVDTSAWPDGKSAIGRLAAMAARGVTVGDLSWTHLTRWREMVSQVFENALYLARLPEISRVRVRYNAANMEPMARYLGAWVANSLESAGVRVEVTLEPGAQDPSVELSGKDFRVELVRQDVRMITTVNGLSDCTNLPRPSDHLLLSEELGIVQRDETFERVLALAARS
jgi:glucose-6-phosphate dehydrogenase assembly protein OpcA